MGSDRVALVRAAYERFNEGDIGGVLDLMDPDIEMPDVTTGTTLHGRESVQASWQRQFELAEHSITASEVTEVGDAVIVAAYHQIYDTGGGPMGSGVAAVHRLTFSGGLITKFELTLLDPVPARVRDRLGLAPE